MIMIGKPISERNRETAIKGEISREREFYNTRRFHQALDYKRPHEVFTESQAVVEAAA
jgi:hypothetical protein